MGDFRHDLEERYKQVALGLRVVERALYTDSAWTMRIHDGEHIPVTPCFEERCVSFGAWADVPDIDTYMAELHCEDALLAVRVYARCTPAGIRALHVWRFNLLMEHLVG